MAEGGGQRWTYTDFTIGKILDKGNGIKGKYKREDFQDTVLANEQLHNKVSSFWILCAFYNLYGTFVYFDCFDIGTMVYVKGLYN